MTETGTVILVGDGIARVYGLRNCMASELLEFEDGSYGMAQNLEDETVSVALLSDQSDIREGTAVRRTGRVLSRTGGRGAAGPGGQCVGQAHRRQGTDRLHRDPPRRSGGPGHHRAAERVGAAADRHQGHRQHDPHRSGTAGAHHRRPPDR